MDMLQKIMGARQRDTTIIPSAGDFDGLPLLSKLMCGVGNADGKGYKLAPHTLTIFLEGSLLKATLGVTGAQDANPKVWLVTSGLSHGLKGIEDALRNDQFEVKPPRNGIHK